ncbi:MAG: hypothetical protein J6V44_07180 [Methanobrevibacter sp.]|nr:hypothetical protein [Methanobrevibacter sp.]
MTIESLKEICDSVNVTFNGNLLFYHKEIVGRYYHIDPLRDDDELVCDVISIGSPHPIEGLNNENEIMNCLVQAIKYFKKLENEKRLKRINYDF